MRKLKISDSFKDSRTCQRAHADLNRETHTHAYTHIHTHTPLTQKHRHTHICAYVYACKHGLVCGRTLVRRQFTAKAMYIYLVALHCPWKNELVMYVCMTECMRG